MPKFLLLLYISALWFITSAAAGGEMVTLVKRGQYVEGYEDKIRDLRAGDVIVTQSANDEVKKRLILGILNQGENLNARTTFIARFVDVSDGMPRDLQATKVLRMPLGTGKVSPRQSYQSFMTAFAEGAHQKRELQGSKVVRMFEEESVLPYEIVVESLEIQFTLEQFAGAFNDWRLDAQRSRSHKPFIVNGMTLSSEQILHIQSDLVDFAVATAEYSFDHDFEGSQLGWVPNRGWVWFDLFKLSERAMYVDDTILFRGVELPKPLVQVIRHRIHEMRRSMGMQVDSGCPSIFDF